MRSIKRTFRRIVDGIGQSLQYTLAVIVLAVRVWSLVPSTSGPSDAKRRRSPDANMDTSGERHYAQNARLC